MSKTYPRHDEIWRDERDAARARVYEYRMNPHSVDHYVVEYGDGESQEFDSREAAIRSARVHTTA